MAMATKSFSDLQQGQAITAMEAAKYIGVHFSTVYRWIKKSEIAYVNFGGLPFIPTIEVARLAKEQHKKGRPEKRQSIVSVTKYMHECQRCGHEWESKTKYPRQCTHCWSRKWREGNVNISA